MKNKEGKRTGLLKQLHSITFGAILTNLVSECCFELIILTSEGIRYQWIGYDEWPIYVLEPFEEEKWARIREKIQEETLTIHDLDETPLKTLLDSNTVVKADKKCAELLSGILELPAQLDGEIYCFFDSEKCSFSFAPDQERIKLILANEYSEVDTIWSDLATEELLIWVKRYEEEAQTIPGTLLGNQ